MCRRADWAVEYSSSTSQIGGGTRLCHRETRQGHSRGRGSQPRLRLYVRSGCVGARIGRWSTLHRQVRSEAALGFVIGKRGKDIPEAEALNHVFGYTCVVDVSARGLGGGVLFIDKSPDTFCPMGPWIVTRDEIPDPQKLSVKFWENEELRQDYNTEDMEHPIQEIVAWASKVATLEVGDVFACGTNHQGLGPMQDGENGTIEIDRIGRMSVKVEDPQKRRWPVGIDRGVGKAVRQWKLTGVRPNPDEMFQTKRIA